jgi:protein-S-isoprenylcysteine O-methyltransferase Ste14
MPKLQIGFPLAYYHWDLIASGGVLILGSTIAAIPLLTMVLPSVILRIRAEDALLRSHYGEAFSHYAEDVPALNPGLRYY